MNNAEAWNIVLRSSWDFISPFLLYAVVFFFGFVVGFGVDGRGGRG